MSNNLHIILFTCFAFGLPVWAMQNNAFEGTVVHGCTGPCYEAWQADTGGVVAIAVAQAEEKANASPAQLGEKAYVGCIACHGAGGEGGVGPQLAGQSIEDITDKLLRYKNGETVGSQSVLMWSQAAQLSETDIDNIAAFVDTL